MKFKLLLLTIALSTMGYTARANNTAPAGAEGETKKYDIAGGVIHSETKKPLSNVSVTVYSFSKIERIVVTDNNGNYSFSELKPGIYKLVFEKDGFKKVTKDRVNIRPEEGCQLNIEMNEEETYKIVPGQLLFSEF